MSEIAGFRVRKPEQNDIGALYVLMNDPEIASMLGGFYIGYSTTDLEDNRPRGAGASCTAPRKTKRSRDRLRVLLALGA
jgi:hypothetical protein